MEVRTARYKLKPSRAQYALLRSIRFQCMLLRNACLQELNDSYRAARREATRHGRDRPIATDWIVVRQHEIRQFLEWQTANEADLRRRYRQAEERRITKLRSVMTKGVIVDPADLLIRPWRGKSAVDFGRGISKQDQMRRLAEIRAADPDKIGAIPLSVLRDQVETVHKAMDAFYRRVAVGETPGYPRFKGFDRIRSIAAPYGDGMQIDGDRLVSKMMWYGAIQINTHRDLPGKPKTIRMTYDGRFWWLTVACEIDAPEIFAHPRPGTAIGLDSGVNILLASDDGTLVPNPKFLEEDAPNTRRLARALARCKRASHNRNKAQRELSRARRRTADRRATHHHKVSKDVVAKAETIFVEDLKVRNIVRSATGTVAEPGVNVAQKRGLNRGMHDAAISALHGMIRYKAASAGGRVIAVDPRHTSQDCSECGGREPGARRRDRYRCSCGVDLHADHNAARNILARGFLAA